MTTIQPGPTSNPAAPSGADVPEVRARAGRWIGPVQVTPVSVVITLVLLGSIIFIGYVTLKVHDNQIPLLAIGFVACGAAWGAIAIGALVAMWRAASWARTGRATGLAIGGGLAGLAAIGCFSIAVLLTLVWNT
jgi:hypothetical protein